MAKYTFICDTSTFGAQRWQVESEFSSDNMAREFAKKIIKDFINCNWLDSLQVFNADEQRHIGTFYITTEVTVTVS